MDVLIERQGKYYQSKDIVKISKKIAPCFGCFSWNGTPCYKSKLGDGNNSVPSQSEEFGELSPCEDFSTASITVSISIMI